MERIETIPRFAKLVLFLLEKVYKQRDYALALKPKHLPVSFFLQ